MWALHNLICRSTFALKANRPFTGAGSGELGLGPGHHK